MRRFITACLALAMVLGMVSVGYAAKTELTWYHCCGQQDRLDLFESWAREFEALNPDVKINDVSPAGYNGKLETSIVAGAGPDVFWAGTMVYKFADVLLPIDDLYNDPAIAEILPVMREAFRWNGHLIAVPYGVNAHTIFYNKDLLGRAGLKMPSDWTWDKVLEMARHMTKDEDGDGTIDKWGFFLPEVSHILTYGGNVYSADGRSVMFNNPATVAAAQLTADLVTGSTGVAPATSVGLERRNVLANGTVAMGNMGVFEVPFMRENVSFDWDTTVFPQLIVDGKAYRTSYFSPETWGIWSGTKEPDLAKKFVRFLMEREHMIQFGNLGAVIPTQNSVAVNSFLKTNNPEHIGAFVQMLNYWKNGWWAHPTRMKIYRMEPFLQIMAGEIPASTGIPELERQAQAQLDEYYAGK